MRHLYECPMRWADLDMLGHVNNVTYIDYLQEARVDMLRVHARSPKTQGLAEGVVVVSHQVTYVAPLLFDFKPVLIETWVTEIRPATFTLAYEVFQEVEGERTVYLRASTVLAPYVFAEERPRRLSAEEKASLEPYLEGEPTPKPDFGDVRRTDLGHFPLKVRFSDVDAYGHVNNVKYFEYFQEARIDLMKRVVDRSGITRWPSVVVAQSDISYHAPLYCRPEPYDVWTSVSKIGTKSMTFEVEVVDPATGTACAHGRTVVVFFDAKAGKAVEPPAEVREAVTDLT